MRAVVLAMALWSVSAAGVAAERDAERRKMMEAGRRTVEGMRGALTRTLHTLEPYVNPLIVQARLDASAGGKR